MTFPNGLKEAGFSRKYRNTSQILENLQNLGAKLLVS
jgi:hypothetical protein